MKNLSKIPRNFSAKFCYLETLKQTTEVSENLVKGDLNALNQQVKKTPESNEYSSQKTIDASLTAIKNSEEMPTGFEKIKASEFLKRSAEELQALFVNSNGIVNFRGNNYAKRQIGLSDLFPKVSDKPQYVVLDGVPYAYGARRGDGKIGYGDPKYKSILGGETIEFFIGSPKQDEDGKSRENFVSFVKDEKGETTQPSKEYSYDKLSKNFAGFYNSEELENLTPDEEKATKNEFLQELQNIEKYETTAWDYKKNLNFEKFETKNFKHDMEIVAKKVGEAFNLPWEVIYAQAGLETGYGKHVPNGNYFGIKGGSSKFSTREYINGKWITINDSFRGYSSMYDSAIGYAKFILTNRRYRKAVIEYRKTKNAKDFLERIKQAGYATDPNYVAKVSSVFKNSFGYDMPDQDVA